MKNMRIIVALAASLAVAGCGREPKTATDFRVHSFTAKLAVQSRDAGELVEMTRYVSNSLDRTMSALDIRAPETDLARLNRVGNSSRLPLSGDSFRLIDMCRHYHAITDGAFDLTTGALSDLWKAGTPSGQDIETALGRMGMQHVDTADNGTSALAWPGVQFTPGLASVAYALDQCAAGFRRKYGKPLRVEYGPFIRRTGEFPPEDTPLLALRIPERLNNAVIGHLNLSTFGAAANLALPHREGRATPPGRVVIDTRTGYPSTGTRLVVVAGPLAIKSYALAEALLVLGLEKGDSILPDFNGYEVMLVPDEEAPEVWMTPGFREAFIPAVDTPVTIRDWNLAPAAKAD